MLLSYGTYARKKCDTINEIQNTHKSLKQVQIHQCIGEVSLKWNTRKNVLEPNKDSHTAAEDVRNEDIRSEVKEAHNEG